MPVEHWSEKVMVVHLGDNPQFADELETLEDLRRKHPSDVVMDFSGVLYVNSSDLSRLLELRNAAAATGNRVILCQLGPKVRGAFLMTALDKVFEISETVPTALATLMLKK